MLSVLWIMGARGQSQVQILTGRVDNSRTGTNSNETFLTVANVNSSQFGKIFAYNVDGYVVAQPLYVPHVSIPGVGVHNVVFVATQHDTVYAFDADTPGSGAPLWSVSFINPVQGITTVPIAEQGCPRVNGYTEVGIMGTPVIDLTSGTMYLDAKTKEVSGNITSYVHRLHALDVTTHAEKFGGPVVIAASVQGPGGEVDFDPLPEMQRPGLLRANGNIYLAYGSNGCDVTAQGWVLAYDATSLAQVGVFATAPGQAWGGSIWQSGVGLAGDSNGNVYFSTANGVFDVNLGGADFADSVIKLGLNGNELSYVDYFTPFDQLNMGQNDLDLGSGGVTLLPDQPPPATQHMLVTSGKTGAIYLIDRDNMGHFDASGNDILQTLSGQLIEYYGNPNYWNHLVYFAPVGETAIKAYALTDGLLSDTPVAQSPDLFVGGLPFISANGSSNGIVWVVRNAARNILSAFDATTLAQLYATVTNSGRDALGSAPHFGTPIVANGRVYAGTQTQLVVYGLLPLLGSSQGNFQSGTVGTILPVALQVQVSDPYSGKPISGFTVNFSDGGRGGAFSSPSPLTNSQGIAATRYRLPQTPGAITITANNPTSTSTVFNERAVGAH
jgi:hypothetical protein